jgi:uncharacterized membrane protein YbaN (DUF454 family)
LPGPGSGGNISAAAADHPFFFLLAAACFFRSSEPLYAWLINHKFFGKRIQYYRVYKAISLRSKLLSLALLWLTIGYSAFFVVKIFWVQIVLLLIAVAVSIHLISFRTLTQKMLENIEGEKTGTGTSF